MLMFLCLVQGVLAALAYSRRSSKSTLAFAVASLLVCFCEPVVMATQHKSSWLLLPNLVAYAFYLGLVVSFLVKSPVMTYPSHVDSVLPCLAVFSCFFMGLAAQYWQPDLKSDVELVATRVLEQLLLNRAHETKIADEATQKSAPTENSKASDRNSVVMHKESQRTLIPEEFAFDHLTRMPLAAEMNAYYQRNWMSSPEELHVEKTRKPPGKVMLESLEEQRRLEDLLHDQMEGLEAIPQVQVPLWADKNHGSITLDQWEKMGHHWPENRPEAIPDWPETISERTISGRTISDRHAPLLHTYRLRNSTLVYKANEEKESVPEPSTPVQEHSPVREDAYFTATTAGPNASTGLLPIKKIASLFKRKSLQLADLIPHHRHSASAATVLSHQQSLNQSLMLGSPKRSFKNLLKVNTPNNRHLFTIPVTQPPPPVPRPPPPIPVLFSMSRAVSASSLDNSRVSSLPSAVIGEYDKEKWRVLKDRQADLNMPCLRRSLANTLRVSRKLDRNDFFYDMTI